MRKPKPNGAIGAKPKLRCAIYTRKSSEEGLEQEFNSLNAQREACEAYIASQRHEGWGVLPRMYDDGGFSGATMDRPALQRLLVDVAAGSIDIVVVYKVDRLTRSLSDFAKIVEIFDKRQVSFVSVTQAFNTTTSMGRLTLNVLLSFAQFEREVTGERIRDKIAASKKKGMWMGGQPPLGYDARDRKLVVNDAEAQVVRHIFRRYRELKSVRLLKTELDAEGILSKVRRGADGSQYGGRPLARGALYLMLANRAYRGEIVHKGHSYPGDHEAIIDEALWSDVQEILSLNRVSRDTGANATEASLLAGIVFDASGERFTPTHAVKNGTRYRYYVSHPLITGSAESQQGQRVPAASLESLVKRRLHELLEDSSAILAATRELGDDAVEQKQLLARAAEYASSWTELPMHELRGFLLATVPRIQVLKEGIDMAVDVAALRRWIETPRDNRDRQTTCDAADRQANRREPGTHVIHLAIAARLKRTGKEMRFVTDGVTDEAQVDASLTRLMVRAHAIRDRLLRDGSLSVDEVARQEGLGPSYVTRLLRLTFLAPDIVSGILAGRHPPELSARKLMADTRLPLMWDEQRALLGFA
jgi:DNA invertase Pin-like site-specific DNA recombinase